MVFSSNIFFVFLPAALLLYYISPRPLRLVVLTLCSYVFYAWSDPRFVLLLLWVTAFDFVCGNLIGGHWKVTHGPQEDCRQLVDDDGRVVIPGNAAPVLVIGDSFGAVLVDQGCGLSQQVTIELGLPVQSAARIGGHGTSMLNALSKPGILSSKRLVLFVFAIRQIPFGGDWQAVTLSP